MQPQILYYTTIEFDDGVFETPHFFVFDSIPDAVGIIHEYYSRLTRKPVNITFKEMVYFDTTILSESTHILVPTNDFGLEDDFLDPIKQQEAVEVAEQSESESLVEVFPDEQDIENLPCKAYFMGPILPAETTEEFVQKLEDDPFEISEPVDYVWLYRPTGETRSIKPRNEDSENQDDSDSDSDTDEHQQAS